MENHMSDKKENVSDKQSWTEYILIHYRMSSAPHHHAQKVASIQKQIRAWNDGAKDNYMCTARPGWQTISFRQPAYKKTFNKIDINLVDILEINIQDRTVRCEPLVTMGQLTHTLVELGWTIPVVPEMDDLTIGGLVMGTGIETSSHKNGLFQHICVAFELVLADGSTVTCSEEKNRDLFYSVPWSYGTVGFLTTATIKIIPAKRFVKIDYHPCSSLESFVNQFQKETNKQNDNQFVEGLLFSINAGVIMTANMTDSAEPGKLNPIGQWHKQWFFKHVQSFLEKGDATEYFPLRDYYHRHTRSIFWEIQDIIPFGNHPIFRWLLGWMIPPKVSLLKLTQSEAIKKLYENNHFIQDMLVPLNKLKDSLKFFDKEVEIYPVWICPFVLPLRPGMLQPANGEESMYVDIGTYGTPKKDFNPVETTRRVEDFVRNAKGFQMLYADTYMTKEEFRKMFEHSLYDNVRKELECTRAFPDVYDKICRNARI